MSPAELAEKVAELDATVYGVRGSGGLVDQIDEVKKLLRQLSQRALIVAVALLSFTVGFGALIVAVLNHG